MRTETTRGVWGGGGRRTLRKTGAVDTSFGRFRPVGTSFGSESGRTVRRREVSGESGGRE